MEPDGLAILLKVALIRMASKVDLDAFHELATSPQTFTTGNGIQIYLDTRSVGLPLSIQISLEELRVPITVDLQNKLSV